MVRARIAFFTLALAALVSFGARPLEQTRPGIIVDFIAPPAIDRGLIPSFERAPDSPETAIRASIRRSNVALDRVGASGAHYIA